MAKALVRPYGQRFDRHLYAMNDGAVSMPAETRKGRRRARQSARRAIRRELDATGRGFENRLVTAIEEMSLSDIAFYDELIAWDLEDDLSA